MRQALAIALASVICAGLLLIWSPERWAASAVEIGIFVVAALWAVHLPGRPESLQLPFPLLPVLGWIAIGAAQLGLHWTVYPWETWNALLYWTSNLLVLLIVSDLASEKRTGERILGGIFVFGVILSIVSVVQVFTSPGKAFWLFPTGYDDFVLGPFVSRNQYAAFLELLLPVALVRSQQRGAIRWNDAVISAALYACVVASASRAGTILATAELAIGMAVLLLRRSLPVRVAMKPVLAMGVLCGLFLAVVGPGLVWQRFRQADPYSARREYLAASISMVRARPWTGFGLGTWSTVYPAYASMDDGTLANEAHNDYAQAAVEGGIPAFLLLGALFLWTVWNSIRVPWGWGLTCVLLHAWVDYPIRRPALGAFYFLLAGLLAAAASRQSKSVRLHTSQTSLTVSRHTILTN